MPQGCATRASICERSCTETRPCGQTTSGRTSLQYTHFTTNGQSEDVHFDVSLGPAQTHLGHLRRRMVHDQAQVHGVPSVHQRTHGKGVSNDAGADAPRPSQLSRPRPFALPWYGKNLAPITDTTSSTNRYATSARGCRCRVAQQRLLGRRPERNGPLVFCLSRLFGIILLE